MKTTGQNRPWLPNFMSKGTKTMQEVRKRMNSYTPERRKELSDMWDSIMKDMKSSALKDMPLIGKYPATIKWELADKGDK